MTSRKASLSPWFPPRIKPVHTGIYETRVAEGLHEGPANWDVDMDAWYTPEWFAYGGRLMLWQNLEWRGLALNPELRS